MPGYFSQYVNQTVKEDNFIPNVYAMHVQDLLLYNDLKDYLTDTELRETVKNLYLLIQLLVKNNKFVLPEEFAGGKAYRAGKIKSGDRTNGYFPLRKHSASQCDTVGRTHEPIWFSPTRLPRYMSLISENQLGLITCRKIRNISKDNSKLNLFINYSTKISSINNDSVLLSKSLQEAINKVILVPIVRNFTIYNKIDYPEDIPYDWIMLNARNISLTHTVLGYTCDDKYKGGTIATLLSSWDYQTGQRSSIYNEDRIHADITFYFFTAIEYILNNLNTSGRSIISGDFKSKIGIRNNDLTINLLGWVAEDTPRQRDQSVFPAEWAISSKFFDKHIRHQIFEQRQDDCKPTFYQYDANAADKYRQVTEPTQEEEATMAKYEQKYEQDIGRRPRSPRYQKLLNAQHNMWNGKGGVKQSVESKYDDYVEKPEDKNSNLFEIFVNNSKEDESKYENESKKRIDAIKTFIKENDDIKTGYSIDKYKANVIIGPSQSDDIIITDGLCPSKHVEIKKNILPDGKLQRTCKIKKQKTLGPTIFDMKKRKEKYPNIENQETIKVTSQVNTAGGKIKTTKRKQMIKKTSNRKTKHKKRKTNHKKRKTNTPLVV
jgi:hypothetical protein